MRLRRPSRNPFVFANFASTLDGVVALERSGVTHAADIVGPGAPDRALMGLLRATADAIVVGAGTIRSAPAHRWIPERIFPPWAGAYATLRSRLGLPPLPLTVAVSASGRLDLTRPFARDAPDRLLVVTTPKGKRRLERSEIPAGVRVAAARGRDSLGAESILAAIARAGTRGRILVEGGPHLLATFLSSDRLDDLFLTIAPRLVGRDPAHPRLGLAEGQAFAPTRIPGGRLLSVRTSDDFLFLRYAFRTGSF